MKRLKQRMFALLVRSPLYPHIYFVRNPSKIYEFREMMRVASVERDHSVLDIGSGAGLQTSLIARRAGRVIGIDVSENAVNRAKSEQSFTDRSGRVEYRCTTMEGASFASEMFDVVCSVCVLEHVENDMEVLQEVFRTLKPGGRIVMSVDSLAPITDMSVLEQHSSKYYVKRYYTSGKLHALLEKCGFVKVVVRPLLCSPLAARLFSDAIRNNFEYRYLEAVLLYARLRLSEPRNGSKGIYLIVTAYKPS